MLILSRKVGQRILIGDGIEVVIQRVSGERVTIGLAAPRDVKILRGELEYYPDQPVAASGRHHATNHHAPATGSLSLPPRRPR